jgi:hypothetical protein
LGVPVASIGKKPVAAWLRSQRRYEELFRDSSFFVRRVEPLHFSPKDCGHFETCIGGLTKPDWTNTLRSPTFWSWTLSVRRGRAVTCAPAQSKLDQMAEAHAAKGDPRPTVGAPSP